MTSKEATYDLVEKVLELLPEGVEMRLYVNGQKGRKNLTQIREIDPVFVVAKFRFDGEAGRGSAVFLPANRNWTYEPPKICVSGGRLEGRNDRYYKKPESAVYAIVEMLSPETEQERAAAETKRRRDRKIRDARTVESAAADNLKDRLGVLGYQPTVSDLARVLERALSSADAADEIREAIIEYRNEMKRARGMLTS